MEIHEYLNIEEDLDGRWCKILVDTDGESIDELLLNSVIIYEDYKDGETVGTFDINEVHPETKSVALEIIISILRSNNEGGNSNVYSYG